MQFEDKLKSFSRFNLPKKEKEYLKLEQDQTAELLEGMVSQNRYGKFVLVEKKFNLDYIHGKIRLASCLEHAGSFNFSISFFMIVVLPTPGCPVKR